MSLIVPPLNFAIVEPGVYRSGYPNKRNFKFIQKLKLKTILYLSDQDLDEENLNFIKSENIKFLHFRFAGNKEPFLTIDDAEMSRALCQVLNVDNHPILIHCNKGKYRVGCLIGCLRKLQRWSLASIFDEYRRFSGSKLRIADQEVIPNFL
jgi:tyrosine-protein phosphatase SIW14